MFQKIKEFLGIYFWQKFPNKIPPKKGWYCCTVEVRGQQRYVMNLYWYPDRQKFIDNVRQDVFNTYEVYGWGPDPKTNYRQRMHTASICDRTEDVVAWRFEPRTYMKGFVKRDLSFDH